MKWCNIKKMSIAHRKGFVTLASKCYVNARVTIIKRILFLMQCAPLMTIAYYDNVQYNNTQDNTFFAKC